MQILTSLGLVRLPPQTDQRCSGRVFIGIGIGIGFVIAIALIAMAGSSAHDVDIDPDPDTDPEAVVCCVALRCYLFPCAQLDSKLKITATLVPSEARASDRPAVWRQAPQSDTSLARY